MKENVAASRAPFWTLHHYKIPRGTKKILAQTSVAPEKVSILLLSRKKNRIR